MKIQIQVTLDDITRGVPSNSRHCPVGRAMARVLGERFHVVGEDVAEIDGWNILTPWEAALFIRAFDNGDPVRPFQFVVDLPDPEPTEDAP